MNIFYLEWNSFCNEDMFEVLKELGHNVVKIPFEGHSVSETQIGRLLDERGGRSACDFLFSFNYFPKASMACQERNIKYVSWVYDSPHIHVYSYTVLNACNFLFLFDYALYTELKNAGITTVYYLPMAVHDDRMKKLKNTPERQKKYGGDISFVGSLYMESKHRLYDKFQTMGDYAKGYLDGVMAVQKNVQGYNFLQEMLTPEIVEEMQRVYPTDPNAQSVMSPEAIYADYVLARWVTAMERTEILENLGRRYPVNLYTYDTAVKIPGVENRGLADYYEEMPYIFKNSKINLNISLRSIKTGIPLRAFDIMGSGGFLLSNYQAEFLEYFEPDVDFVYYSSLEELLEKTDFYLKHDKERRKIAESGCKKVWQQHSMKLRVQAILEVMAGEKR